MTFPFEAMECYHPKKGAKMPKEKPTPLNPIGESVLLNSVSQVLRNESRRIDLDLTLFGQDLAISIYRMAGFIRVDLKPKKTETIVTK
jgi:hypothetical protein